MARRCIGIDIGPSYLRAVQMVNAAGRLSIEKVFYRQMRRTTDSPEKILKKLASGYGFDRRADVAVAMPQQSVFFSKFETDRDGLEKLKNGDFASLENNFPIASDDLVIRLYSHISNDRQGFSVLAAAVSKQLLAERVESVSQAKLKTALVDSAIFAIYSSIAHSHPEINTGRAFIAHIGGCHITLAAVRNNRLLIIRNVPTGTGAARDEGSVSKEIAELLVQQATITSQKVFADKPDSDTKFFIVAEENMCGHLAEYVRKNLTSSVIIVAPYAGLNVPPEYKPDPMFAVAVGLALRAQSAEKSCGVNFLAGKKEAAITRLDVKKEAVCFIALICAIFFVWLVSLFVRLSYLEKTYAALKEDINTTFKKALPQENNVVSPLVQLEQQLQSISSDYAVFGPAAAAEPLDVLYVLSSTIEPELGISIENVLITTESVRLTGTSLSFESVYQLQRQLSGERRFSNVDVQDIATEQKGGLVHFNMLISLAKERFQCI